MKAFITGIGGFAGSHLAEHLVESGWEVCGIETQGRSLENLENVSGEVRVAECDIRDGKGVGASIAAESPDVVFHLAATSFIPSAEKAVRDAFDINVGGSLNILETCHRNAGCSRIIMISSGSVYGAARGERRMPLAEEQQPSPADFYAVTKLLAEELSLYYHRSHSMPVVILRPFNHIGPRQGPSFVTSSFAFQIAEIEAGKRPPTIMVGNLEATRDFTDVRDMVRAYRMAAERCYTGQTYNICSGQARRIGEMLERMLRLTKAKIQISEDSKRLRESDVPILYGDPSRFERATGWRREREIDSTLKDILDYWRTRVRNP